METERSMAWKRLRNTNRIAKLRSEGDWTCWRGTTAEERGIV
jgi:hypothetical protein